MLILKIKVVDVFAKIREEHVTFCCFKCFIVNKSSLCFHPLEFLVMPIKSKLQKDGKLGALLQKNNPALTHILIFT